MSDSEIAIYKQSNELVACFARFMNAKVKNFDGVELQKAIEDKDDPLWIAVMDRFAKKGMSGDEVTLKSLIALGHYDYVEPEITTEKYFRMPKNIVFGTEPKLFHFNRNISSDDAIKEMDKEGYKPATIWDLLDFGAKNPGAQRKFRILALGSIKKVHRSRGLVVDLAGDDSSRGINLNWFEDDYSSGDQFLAVRK